MVLCSFYGPHKLTCMPDNTWQRLGDILADLDQATSSVWGVLLEGQVSMRPVKGINCFMF